MTHHYFLTKEERLTETAYLVSLSPGEFNKAWNKLPSFIRNDLLVEMQERGLLK